MSVRMRMSSRIHELNVRVIHRIRGSLAIFLQLRNDVATILTSDACSLTSLLFHGVIVVETVRPTTAAAGTTHERGVIVATDGCAVLRDTRGIRIATATATTACGCATISIAIASSISVSIAL